MPDEVDAVRALRHRGVNNAEPLLELGTPNEILDACHRWDRQEGVSPGLLVSWIRNGEFEPEPPPPEPAANRLHAIFDEYAARFPAGTPIHSPHYRSVPVENPPPHARIWDRIRQENCPGTVRVAGANFPTIYAECDSCRYDCATPAAQLHTLEEAAR